MARPCQASSIDEDERLWNRSSDDSLILDGGNMCEALADSEDESATFQLLKAGKSSSFAVHPYNVVDVGQEQFTRPRDMWSDRTSLPSINFTSMQARLSLSGEDSEVPLLPNEGWHLQETSEFVRHCHSSYTTAPSNVSWRRLISASVLCLFFMVAEILGGLFSGSVATMTDAAHLLSDLVGLLVSLSAVWLGQRPPTKTLSFGYHRAEVLGALLSIFIIWVLTGIFVYIAILRLVHGNINIQADRMMAVAAGGIVINIIMGLVLHGGCHLHSGSHSHSFGHQQCLHRRVDGQEDQQQSFYLGHSNVDAVGYLEDPSNARSTDRNQAHKGTNINVRAAAIHVLGDLIQSIGVFIAAVVIKFNPDAKIADPICTFLFAIVVLATTVPLLKDVGLVLLEGFPQTISYTQVFAVLHDIPGVQHVHSLHVWSLTMGKHFLSVHLAVDSAVERDIILSKAQQILHTKFGIDTCTIQTEIFDLPTITACFQCKPLRS